MPTTRILEHVIGAVKVDIIEMEIPVSSVTLRHVA